MTNWSIGVDLGASTFKCGLISPEYKIVARKQAPTLAIEGPTQAADRIAAQVRELMAELPAGAVVNQLGVCSPGPIDHTMGMIIDPPNLTGWRNVPFAALLSERLGIPVQLEHDAKAAALGEFHFGAGRGTDSMVLIIVGTGIGAAMIVNGELYRGEKDASGEIGHITVDLDGTICTCGSRGCIETYACGPAIMSAYTYSTRKPVESAEEVVRAANEGDGIARRVLERAGHALGAGIATTAMIMDITTFVLFGSVVKAGELLLKPAREAVPWYAHQSVSARVRVLVGELGNDAGILGAAWGAGGQRMESG
ncbi:MAG TPA: ROK family protein [Anaerolineae bacterium]|nr:ROK family protein [Anaerolineae bacterium]